MKKKCLVGIINVDMFRENAVLNVEDLNYMELLESK